MIIKPLQVIPMALHSVNLMGEDVKAGNLRQGARVIEIFEGLSQ
jgi:hypothetical protein